MKDTRLTAASAILILTGTLHAGDFALSREDVLGTTPPPAVAGKPLQQGLPEMTPTPYTLDSLLRLLAQENIEPAGAPQRSTHGLPDVLESWGFSVDTDSQIRDLLKISIFRDERTARSYEINGTHTPRNWKPNYIYTTRYAGRILGSSRGLFPTGFIRARNIIIRFDSGGIFDSSTFGHLVKLLEKSGETVDSFEETGTIPARN